MRERKIFMLTTKPAPCLSPLADADVLAYLASKQSHEVIGYCADAGRCVIAEAYTHRYGLEVFADEDDFYGGVLIKYPERTSCSLTPMMVNMLHIFDHLERPGMPILKSAFVTAWDAFKVRKWRTGK
jgi:hypothetical protein